MCYLGLQVCGQVNDGDGFEWASITRLDIQLTVERPNTHFLTQIPQPMHKNSEIKAILSVGLTSIQSFPEYTLVVTQYLPRYTYPFSRPDMTSTLIIRDDRISRR
ncbi:hypothetical protein BDQ12DRAFT_613453 [Crucibulum laeve]|uniref:Uncharacterized protein n=1 Tax=Crucibulum laeve TaxID=68775 RepID=A0A5C3LQ60_9AGAR|nr:hypothetical protein BDQ12DRAFT_613453 [Crucibulum laeve]